MPIPYLPLILPAIFIIVLFVGMRKGKKPFLIVLISEAIVVIAISLPFWLPGLYYAFGAYNGNAKSQFELAKWYETHQEKIGSIYFYPFSPNEEKSFAWLKKSSDNGYLLAEYTLGVRLKMGYGVPRPDTWSGSGGNVFPQPEKGQPLIDLAIKNGFKPTAPESDYYPKLFRQ